MLDKASRTMYRQIMSALAHMITIDKESEAEILAEIARIKEGTTAPAPKKKEEVVEAVAKKTES